MKSKIREFAKMHGCTIDEKILDSVLKLGRCPCRVNRVKCPCKDAAKDIEKNGHCHCGLFRKDG